MSVAHAILLAFAVYAGAGVVIAIAFVSVGIRRILPHPMPVTLGARLLILPGAFALWPYIAFRWRKARSRA
jgi:hypothetical protein